MARTPSAAFLAALIATAPLAALAQTATDAPAPAAAATAGDAAAPAAVAAETTPAAADAPVPATPAPTAPAADAPAAAAPAPDSAATTETGTAPAATPATPAPAAGSDAAAAAPAGEPQVGAYYTKGTHGDWQLRCMKAPEGQDPCELYQLMKDAQGAAVAEVSVIPFTGRAAAVVNFVSPLETDLTTGLGFQIDSGKNSAYPFLVCAQIGCIARVGMTEAELAAMKNGNAATVSLLPYGGEAAKNTVKLTLSLKGFTAGFEALKAAMPAPAAQ
ncbi:invasion associated locus B family protein [Paracoccus endophyticus]|uniref:invasion associated locus B family protein n=1 Tax=Paracoccus endophyticus TaxID=2233774 RepID=UPI000DD6389E|nr:invasion associated locus B family protein [Paracoccus endophyticus]